MKEYVVSMEDEKISYTLYVRGVAVEVKEGKTIERDLTREDIDELINRKIKLNNSNIMSGIESLGLSNLKY